VERKVSLFQPLKPYVCGGSAAIVSSVCIHPIDLVKVHIQLYGQKNPTGSIGPLETAANVIRNEGIAGLYAGVGASVLRQAVYGTARLGMHRSFSNYLQERRLQQGESGPLPLALKSLSSASTGAIAATIGCPIDVVLVRMQADTMAPAAEKRGYRNVFHAMFSVASNEGVGTLWRGCLPLVYRGASMNLGMLASYDQAKQILTELNGDNFGTKLASSAVSGFSCAFASLPFDLIKSRLMNMKVDATGKLPYNGVLDCGVQIIRKEGFLALWKGFFTYYCRCAPHAMITMLLVEQFTEIWKNNLE